MAETISKNVVQEDARLEKAAEGSRLALAKHRWHWTLDELNGKRVSIREYARQVGRSHMTIRDMVNGYNDWSVSGAANSDLGDYLARAKIRGESREATVAVAQARGISVETARRHHANEVRSVQATAQERAERRGTTVAEEIPDVAQTRVKFQQSQAKQTAERKGRHTLRYISVEGKVASAMRYLRAALDEMTDVDFTDEEKELMHDSVGKARQVLDLLDLRTTNAADVDWDAEMAKLTEGEPK